MADNRHKYGFRFYSAQGGGGRAACFEAFVASGYQANVGATPANVGLSLGDPVSRVASGFVELAGDTTLPGWTYGVIYGIRGKVDPNNKARPVSYLPGGTTFATEETETRLIVASFADHYWEIDADDVVTATTQAAYRALIGENVNLAYWPDSTNPDKPRANPMLAIAGHAVTAALNFRIVGVSKTRENFDFSGANVKLLVQLNMGIDPMLSGVTGTIGI
jgi:hypothetical protein